MPPYKTPQPYICGECEREITISNYFWLKIQNQESKIGRQTYICRDCLIEGLVDLPPSAIEEQLRLKFQSKENK